MGLVPNYFPTSNQTKRIAIIGEAPGKAEVENRTCPGCRVNAPWDYCFRCKLTTKPNPQPFVGASGKLLADTLMVAGFSKSNCFLGNVAQSRPTDNDISGYQWDGDEVQSGLEQLKQDLVQFNPNIVVLLGNVPLKAAKDPESNHPLKAGRYRFSNSNWRGSLFVPTIGPFAGRKCVASYHPAYVLRDYSALPYLHFDLKRAIAEAASPVLTLPERQLVIVYDATQAISILTRARAEKWTISPDIEGGVQTMSCISIAPSPTLSYIIPFIRKDLSRVFEPEDEKAILVQLCLTMIDPGVPKVFQNGLYDRFVLQYSYHIPVLGNVDDTMLAGWELNCEIEKGLGVLTSLYTREPHYKGDRKTQDDETFYRYCGMDGAVTFEIRDFLVNALRGTSLTHYRLNMNLLNPLLYMELRGIRYDGAKAAARRADLQTKLYEAQARLNALVGHCFSWRSLGEIRQRVDSLMLTVKGDRPRKQYVEDYRRVHVLLNQGGNLATIGEIEDLAKASLNVDSKEFKPYLYETLKLPEQWKENKVTGVPSLTADYEALLKLSRYCQKQSLAFELQVVQLAIEIRALGTRIGMLGISSDNDGRVRCAYNLVGSETGRITCYTSPTGSGYNLQTIPNYTAIKDAPGGVLGDRDLFLADDGYWFFQCDLSGADGWTYAAYSAMLGDPTMLDDYQYGLKPAKILALMLRGVQVDFQDRAAIKEASRQVDKDDWDYFACKRVQHGAAYCEGEETISRSILKDSEGKLFMDKVECKKLKQFYFIRYTGIERWHNWVASGLKRRPVLVAASGQVRRFFGRPDELLTKAVAFEPQANTTYATNLATNRLWMDPENRTSQGLRIEPLHTIHDALAGQFSKSDTTWAAGRIKSYFDNPLVIAGQSIVIPYEGGYGVAWGDLKEGKL